MKRRKQSYSYTFISPRGKEYCDVDFAKFCKLHKFNYNSVHCIIQRDVKKGNTISSYKNWSVKRSIRFKNESNVSIESSKKKINTVFNRLMRNPSLENISLMEKHIKDLKHVLSK